MRRFRLFSREMFKLDRLEADRNVPGLIAALGGDARGDAALALGRLGEPRAIPYLVELLRDDPEPKVRLFTAYALGQLRAKDAEGALVEALNDPAPIVRMGSAEALGSIGARQAIPQLREVLESDPTSTYASTQSSRSSCWETQSRALAWQRCSRRFRGECAVLRAGSDSGKPSRPWRRASRSPRGGTD